MMARKIAEDYAKLTYVPIADPDAKGRPRPPASTPTPPSVSDLEELYIATDVEADGPIPGPYSMLSLGMSVAGRPQLAFYTELKPISDDFDPEALAVSGLDRDRLLREAPHAADAMKAAAAWVNGLRALGRPVFLAAPAVWDGMFVHWYFVRFTGASPFGATGAGVDLRSYWMGRTGCAWSQTRKSTIKHSLGLDALPHTHHAGEDAAELAQVFQAAATSRTAGATHHAVEDRPVDLKCICKTRAGGFFDIDDLCDMHGDFAGSLPKTEGDVCPAVLDHTDDQTQCQLARGWNDHVYHRHKSDDGTVRVWTNNEAK